MSDLLTDVCYPGETGLPCTVAVDLYHRAFEATRHVVNTCAEVGSEAWEEMRTAERAYRTHRNLRPCREEQCSGGIE